MAPGSRPRSRSCSEGWRRAGCAGGLEGNHPKTKGDDRWLAFFCLYAPEQPFFNKTFTLDDFETVDCPKGGDLCGGGVSNVSTH
jgi:hypothetical protein